MLNPMELCTIKRLKMKLAMLIGEVVKSIDPLLPIMCLAGSQMITVLESFGLKAMPESFADRT